MPATHTAAQVAEDLGCSEWTVLELVRQGKVDCIRINTAGKSNGPVRFTDEQVAKIFASLTVQAEQVEAPRRRKRRVS